MNYKSGDLVKITGNCTWHNFNVGETVRLKRNCGGELHVWTAEYLDGHDFWHVRESDMTPVKPATMPQKIIITTDGKTTLARLFDGKTMVKRAEAKCSPSDTFDFGVGAELAVKRLMGGKPVAGNPVTEPAESEPVKLYCVKSFIDILSAGKIYEPDESGHIAYNDGRKSNHSVSDWKFDFIRIGNLVPLVRRPAKVGEWVYLIKEPCVNTSREFQCAYHKGDIVRIDFFGCFPSVKTDCAGGFSGFREDEYLVLDGYTGGPA